MKRNYHKFNKIYILLFFISTVTFLNFISPPFQYPDEPQHFGAILTYSLGEDNKDFIEREIIKIMDKNSWWRFVGLGKPASLPDSFSKMSFLSFGDFKATFGNIILYHFLLGKIQKIFIKDNIILSYYFCRFFSILFVISSFYLIFLTFKKAVNINFLSTGFLFVLFLPQLATLLVGVTSDTLSLFLTSLFFFAAFSLIRGELKINYFFLLLFSAGAGFLTDRSILFLMPLAILVPLFSFKKREYKINIIITIIFFSTYALLIALLLKLFPVQFKNSLNIIKMHYQPSFQKIPSLFSLSKFHQEFFTLLADSFLLKFGWWAFSAQRIFYYLWRSLILFSFLGIFIYFAKYIYLRIKKIHDMFLHLNLLKLVLFSLIPVSLQIINMWILSSPQNLFVQGRYLFPVIIPITLLFLLGLKSFFGLFHKRAGEIAISLFMVLEFFFFNYVIWNYMVPIFHLTVKAPHPGI